VGILGTVSGPLVPEREQRSLLGLAVPVVYIRKVKTQVAKGLEYSLLNTITFFYCVAVDFVHKVCEFVHSSHILNI
jgi:hypothetical protein